MRMNEVNKGTSSTRKCISKTCAPYIVYPHVALKNLP